MGAGLVQFRREQVRAVQPPGSSIRSVSTGRREHHTLDQYQTRHMQTAAYASGWCAIGLRACCAIRSLRYASIARAWTESTLRYASTGHRLAHAWEHTLGQYRTSRSKRLGRQIPAPTSCPDRLSNLRAVQAPTA
eukprot:1888850-Rhodomonas_salina.2